MGKNNKARRAAKAKARAKARSRNEPASSPWSAEGRTGPGRGSPWGPPPDDEPLFTEAEVARNLLVLTAQAQQQLSLIHI